MENSDAHALPGDDNLLFAVGPPASIHTCKRRGFERGEKETEWNEREWDEEWKEWEGI